MILITYGTRPEWLKVKSVIKNFKENNVAHKVLCVKQHTTLLPKDSFYDFQIELRSELDNRLDEIYASIFDDQQPIFSGVEYVMVQGDTSTASAIALKAVHHNVKVIHLEAGMRTWDRKNPWPEEYNRQVITAVADIHLTPSHHELQYIFGLNKDEKIAFVGSTALDNLVGMNKKNGNEVLITLHRRENAEELADWISVVENLSQIYSELDFTLVKHPNYSPDIQEMLKDSVLRSVEPMEHELFLEKMLNSKIVITDSGGIQEETNFFRIPCIICRKATERHCTLGMNAVLAREPSELKVSFQDVMKQKKMVYECPYGEGEAAENVLNALKGFGAVEYNKVADEEKK